MKNSPRREDQARQIFGGELSHTLKSFRVEGIYIDARAATAEHTERRKNGPALRDSLKERIERAKQLLGKQLSDVQLAPHLEACDLASLGTMSRKAGRSGGIEPATPSSRTRCDAGGSLNVQRFLTFAGRLFTFGSPGAVAERMA